MTSKKPIGCWAITISCNHSDLPTPEEMKATFNELATHWCFQLERGSNAGKLHYQCRVIMEPKQYGATMLTILSARKPYEAKDIDLKPESNASVAQGGLAFYVLKDETREDGPWYDPSYKKPKPAPVYEGKDLAVMKKPFCFQATIINMVKADPDDRTIHWIYNKKGCAGKSKLMKYLRFKDYDFARVPLGTATQIKTCVIAKGAKAIYMVDLPRVRGNDERITEVFSALEEIKNGWVVGAMFGKDDELLMEPPHVFIFSNEVPNMAIASPDRWKIYTLYNHNDDVRLRQLTTEDVASIYKEQIEASRSARHPKRKRDEESEEEGP